MNLKYIDVDTQEVIDVINDPSLAVYRACVEQYAMNLGATVLRMIPAENDNEWTVELKIPIEVRQRQTPLSGERVRFIIKLVIQEFEITGIYMHKKNQFHIVQDEYGREWKIQSIWQMKKL